MNVFPLSPTVALAACTALGALILTGAGIFAFKKLKSPSKAKLVSFPGLLGDITNSPILKEIEKVVVTAIYDSHHAALNAAVAKMFPGLAPFITGPLDQVVDNALTDVTGIQPPANNAVVIPSGHPILDLLHKAVEAHLQQQKK